MRSELVSKYILAFVFTVLIYSQAKAYEAGNAFKSIDEFFWAISQTNHKDMKALVSDTFILLEYGEVWSISDLIKVVKPVDYARENYFSIINMHDHGNLVTVNYWNKANFNNSNYNQTVIWLESAIIEKIKGEWLISQLHSTRLPPGKIPKDVVYTKQKRKQSK